MNTSASDIAPPPPPPPSGATIFQQQTSAPKSTGGSIFGGGGGHSDGPAAGPGGFGNVFAFNWYVTPNQVAQAPDGDKYVARENLPFVVTLVAVAGAILIVGVVTGVILHYMKATKLEASDGGYLERQPQSTDKKISAPILTSKEADVGVNTLTSSTQNTNTQADYMNLPTSRITSAVYSPISPARPISSVEPEAVTKIEDDFDVLDSPTALPNQVPPLPTIPDRCHTIMEEEEDDMGLTMGASQTDTICMTEDVKIDAGDYYNAKHLPPYSTATNSREESFMGGHSFNNY